MDKLQSDLRPPLASRAGGSTDPLRTGLNRAAGMGVIVLICAGLVLGIDTPRGWVVPAGLYLLTLGLVHRLIRPFHPHPRFGPGNAVTLIRAALVCALAGPLAAGEATGWAVVAVGGLALALDGVDGWLARRSGLVSDFGARFDMEIDAAMALILALHAFTGTAAGAEVLALGTIRYVFVAATILSPWLAAPLPPKFRRKAVCVQQLATLIALQLPNLADDAAIILARLALATVLWSFLVDILWLRKTRA